MCTKVPYANRWQAAQSLKRLRAAGRRERGIYLCFADHPGRWQLTSKRTRRW